MWDLGTIVAMNNDEKVKKKMNKGLNMTIHMPRDRELQNRFMVSMSDNNPINRKKKK